MHLIRSAGAAAVPQHEVAPRSAPDHLDRLHRRHAIMPVPQLIIWPETAFAGLLDREAALFKETVWSALPFDGWMITGVPRFDELEGCSIQPPLSGLR